MRASLLQLDSYHVDELSFSLDDKYNYDPEDEPTLTATDLDVAVEPWQHPEDPLKWFFRLSVRLDDKEGKFLYTFAIKMSGFFTASKDCPETFANQLVMVNAPSILYASARELLAIVTGRSRYPSVILPSITFFEPPPTAQTTKALKSGAPSKSRKTVAKKK